MKKIGILVLILVLLLGGYFLSQYLSQPPEFEAPSDYLISEWNNERVDELRFVFNGERQMVVKEKDGQWYIGDAFAEPSRVSSLFEGFENAEITSRVSTNSQNHERFDVNGSGTRLALVDDNEIIQEIIFGKSAGGNTMYVRLPEQDDVYVLSGVPQYLFQNNEDEWYDTRLFRGNRDDVRRVLYTQGFINWELSKLSGSWQFGNTQFAPQDVSEDKAKNLIGRATGNSASRIIEEKREDIVSGRGELLKIEIEIGTPEEFRSKNTYLYYRGDQPEEYFVYRNDEEVGFVITQEQYNNILLNYSDALELLTEDEENK